MQLPVLLDRSRPDSLTNQLVEQLRDEGGVSLERCSGERRLAEVVRLVRRSAALEQQTDHLDVPVVARQHEEAVAFLVARMVASPRANRAIAGRLRTTCPSTWTKRSADSFSSAMASSSVSAPCSVTPLRQ